MKNQKTKIVKGDTKRKNEIFIIGNFLRANKENGHNNMQHSDYNMLNKKQQIIHQFIINK